MPKFLAIAAVTLDGKIAKGPSHMSNWTSKEDKVFMRALLDKCDVIIVGNNTYKTAIKPLSKRNCIVISRSVISKQKTEKPQYCQRDKKQLQKIIRSGGYKKIAILGGARTYTFCLQNKMLDEIYLTIEPLVFGRGINLFADAKNFEKTFKLAAVKKLNNKGSILLRYKK